jgi:hypothetical protein
VATSTGTFQQHLPGPYVDVEILGDTRQVDNILRSLYGAFEDQTLAWDFLQDYVDPVLRKRTEERFQGEGDDVSGPWLPLAPATVLRRGSAHPINVRTGQMKRYLLDEPPDIVTHSLGATMWSPGRTGSRELQSKVGTAQQGGTTPEGRPVPPRPVLGVNENDAELILIEAAKYIGKHVARGGATVNWL